MRKFKTLFSILLAAMLAMTVFCGCGDDKSAKNDTKNKAKSSDTDSKYSPEEAEEEIQKIIDGIGKDDSQAVTTTQEKETPAPSTGWDSFKFNLDGKECYLGMDYSKFKELTGWAIDLKDLGYPDGFILNPKGNTSSADIYNSKYRTLADDHIMAMQTGFYNASTGALDIEKCVIWSIDMDVSNAMRENVPYPKLVLSNGITWGSSKEDIEKAYGKPDDTYRAEEQKYTVYTYKKPNMDQMRLEIYDDGGLKWVTMKSHTVMGAK